jgi:hypothetical protein
MLHLNTVPSSGTAHSLRASTPCRTSHLMPHVIAGRCGVLTYVQVFDSMLTLTVFVSCLSTLPASAGYVLRVCTPVLVIRLPLHLVPPAFASDCAQPGFHADRFCATPFQRYPLQASEPQQQHIHRMCTPATPRPTSACRSCADNSLFLFGLDGPVPVFHLLAFSATGLPFNHGPCHTHHVILICNPFVFIQLLC